MSKTRTDGINTVNKSLLLKRVEKFSEANEADEMNTKKITKNVFEEKTTFAIVAGFAFFFILFLH